MAITLAEAKVGMADKVDQQVVDMFRRSSLLLDQMVFDNAISPGTGGSTLTYGYIQLKTPATASVRTINGEYTPGEAKREKKTTNAIIMGGAFQIDRVLQNTSGAADELAFQAEQKIKATANYFHNLTINGTSESSGEGYIPNTFDGLKKLLTGTANEITSQVSLKTSAELDSNYNAFLDEMDSFLSCLDGSASLLLMNRAMLVTVMYRLAGSPEGELSQAQASFADVPADSWYASYVRWGVSRGIASGTGADTFSIPLSRAGLAEYLNCERSALCREISRMRAEGLIETYKNSFKILDRAALARDYQR